MARDIYYYIDINLKTHKIVDWGTSKTANLTGNTLDENVHRMFLTPGQYNKMVNKFSKTTK